MKRGRPHTRQQEQGFTLIEVITALAILSVMITLNYKILLGIMKSKQMLDDKREGMFLANSLLTRISKELQLTVRRPLLPSCNGLTTGSNNQSGVQKNPFLITESVTGGMSLSFIAQEAGQYVPDGGTHSGLVQITYRPAKGSSGEDQLPDGQFYLIREEIPYTKPLSTACKNALRFPIANNLTSINFKFFNKESKQWSDVWQNEDSRKLPAIIQFSAKLKTPRGKTETYTSAVKLHGE